MNAFGVRALKPVVERPSKTFKNDNLRSSTSRARHSLVVLLLHLARPPAGGRQGHEMPVAVVYIGVASTEESECPGAVKDALEDNGFDVTFAGDGADISVPDALAELNPDVYVQPGGGDDMGEAWDAVKGPVMAAITSYVRRGGHYVGICMGSFLASKGEEDDDFDGYDLLSEAGWEALDYKERAGASVRDMSQTLVSVDWRGQAKDIFFQGGPCFAPINDEGEGTVLATYSNGDAAAIVVPYGQGKVGVTGPHPEASASWYDDVVSEGGPRGRVQHELFMDLVRSTMA